MDGSFNATAKAVLFNSSITQWLSSVHFTDANNGWAVGDTGAIIHTANGGTTWTAQSSRTTLPLNSVHFTDSSNGWAVGNTGAIIHTANGGKTWTAQSSGTILRLSSVHFTDANNGWAVGDTGAIIHTANGGTTWTAQSSGTILRLSLVHFIDANNGWAVGNNGTIIHTANGGTTWAAQSSGTKQDLYSVHFTNANTGWVVGTSGIILVTGIDPNLSASVLNSPFDNAVAISLPTKNFGLGSEGMLRFGLAQRAHVTAKLFDSRGRLSEILINEVRDAGYYALQSEGVSRGTYLLEFKAGEFHKTMMVIKP